MEAGFRPGQTPRRYVPREAAGGGGTQTTLRTIALHATESINIITTSSNNCDSKRHSRGAIFYNKIRCPYVAFVTFVTSGRKFAVKTIEGNR
jgi:hypothetical protein